MANKPLKQDGRPFLFVTSKTSMIISYCRCYHEGGVYSAISIWWRFNLQPHSEDSDDYDCIVTAQRPKIKTYLKSTFGDLVLWTKSIQTKEVAKETGH